jgi:hypothetical protein
MRFVNAGFVVVTLFVVLGGYLQERKRFATIRELSPERARALFEATERRRERTMAVVTAALVLASTVALVLRVVR